MRNLVFIFLALITFTAAANAQVPVASAQAAPLKVGVVNTAMFGNSTGGITKLVAVLRVLETEFKPRRDEITALVTRFEALQKQPTTGANASSTRRQTRTDPVAADRDPSQTGRRACCIRKAARNTDRTDTTEHFQFARGICKNAGHRSAHRPGEVSRRRAARKQRRGSHRGVRSRLQYEESVVSHPGSNAEIAEFAETFFRKSPRAPRSLRLNQPSRSLKLKVPMSFSSS